MRELVLVFALAGCLGAQEPAPAPGTSFGRAPSPGGAVPWNGSADGMPLSLRAKFEPSPGVVHVPPFEGSPDDDGPFAGNELGGEDLPALGEEFAAMVIHARLHACLELDGGMFVLRVPARREEGSDLALAAWTTGGRLEWVADLAWSHCDAEGCTRQEAWLAPVDPDDLPDLVTRFQSEPATGAAEERWSAYRLRPDLGLDELDASSIDRASLAR